MSDNMKYLSVLFKQLHRLKVTWGKPVSGIKHTEQETQYTHHELVIFHIIVVLIAR